MMAATSTAAIVRPARGAAGGFTLLELLVTLTMIAMVSAMVIPNLGTFVPSARLEGSGKQLLRTIDWVRSEARIQARRMSLELDLDHARWRVVFPPEVMLTRDQEPESLEDWSFEWKSLEDGVVFAGAGEAKNGIARKNIYKILFDEHGFTSDQLVILKLTETGSQLLWSMELRGLTGNVEIIKSDDGHEPQLELVGEGAF
jgi:prepilin-type N-terminal cleavage/methylation domain-containing protein